ncbi:uncharacterized protein [Henckelia pumila]|uniref:uncharacterized protein n=1 Tax=Henckelia pumila TaxID=405737 RepID=UPI003C6E659F
MKPHGVTDKKIQLRAFPFLLKNAAKDWLYCLPPGSITTRTAMKRIFPKKYFPASRAANIRKEIYGIKQQMGESLHEYWERFKKLCASCPQHQISENLLIQYFYEGFLPHDRSMVNAASGEVFVDKTPQAARNLIENMAANSQQFGTNRSDYAPRRSNEETRASIQHLNTHVGQLATTINRLEAQNSSSLPFQTVPNPKENVRAITLRSERELKVHEEVVQEPIQNEDLKDSKLEENELNHEDTPKGKFPPLSEYKPVPPFPLTLKESRKDEIIKGLYDTFRRCEINIPAKCKDPSMFSIPCKIGDVQLDTAMLDLGASINVMPYSTYASLKLRPLNETATIIHMADRSTIYPRGVIEDVLVQVGSLVFPADFYVLDMKNNDLKSAILLERPFLKTSNCESVVNVIDVNNHLSKENKEFGNWNKLEKVVAKYAKHSNDKIFLSDLQIIVVMPSV